MKVTGLTPMQRSVVADTLIQADGLNVTSLSDGRLEARPSGSRLVVVSLARSVVIAESRESALQLVDLLGQRRLQLKAAGDKGGNLAASITQTKIRAALE